MICHCHCHDLAMQLHPDKILSSYGCPSCDDFHKPAASPGVKATAQNVRALIAETAAHNYEPYAAIKYRFRVKLTPYDHIEVDVAVSTHLAQSNWMDADEEAHRHVAQHLNAYWKKNPQSDWAAKALVEANKHPKPQVGGHALTFGASWYEGMTQQHHVYQAVSGDVVTSDLTKWLPGLNEAVVCPAKIAATCGACWGKAVTCTHTDVLSNCPAQNVVQRMIVHLNDDHRWKRAQIADWLETLDVDLTFGAEPPPPPRLLPKADRGKVLYIIANTARQAQAEARRRRRGPQDYRYVSTQDGHASQIRGTHKAQYCVVQGTVVIPPIQHLLDAAQAVQVGEEVPSGPGVYVEGVQAYYDEIKQYVGTVQYEIKAADTAMDALKQDLAKLKEPDKQQKKFGVKKFVLDQGPEGSSVGFAAMSDFVKALYQQSQEADPWPGHPVTVNKEKSEIKCSGPGCGICKLIAANAGTHHEPKPDPKQKALDAKKNPSHTAFTVNPTKKNPFKKK